MTAWSWGLILESNSLSYSLKNKDEEVSGAVCLKHVRWVIPLLILDIAELVRKYKGFPKSKCIFRFFEYEFVKRRREVPCNNPAKIIFQMHS